MDIITQANEYMLEVFKEKAASDNKEKDDDDHSNSPKGRGGKEQPDTEINNEGTLILDATCAPSDIRFPQDFSLLNEAREKLKTIIIRFYKSSGFGRPHMYCRQARKNYLALAKAKKRSTKKIKATIRKQLFYVKCDIKYLEYYMEEGYAPTSGDISLDDHI